MPASNELTPAESRRAVLAWKLGNKAASAVREGLAVIKQREDAARIGPCRKCGETCFDSLCEQCADLDSVKDAIAPEIARMAAKTHARARTGRKSRRTVGKPASGVPVPSVEQWFTIPGAPMGKPRMTQRDKWAQRDCVMQYRAWCDRARLNCLGVTATPVALDFTAHIPMPPSWSKKKQAAMAGELHRQKPDLDNIAKAIMDALWEDDSGIAHLHGHKFWCRNEDANIELSVR